jgi:DNA helicase-2/ATP-dependent DNA helicase PcrA
VTTAHFEPTPRQQEVLDATEPRVLVVGGPGTGKTATAIAKARSLTESVPSKRVLFVTFSRAAVAELVSRLPGVLGDAASRVDIFTFHAYAVGLLDSFGRYGGFGTAPVTIITPAEDELGVGPPGGVVYDDLVPRAILLLRSSNWVRERLIDRYAAVICDEYQDTGSEESELLELLSARSQLVCFADPRQLIYEWLGSDRNERLDKFRESGPREISFGDASHRDPSSVIPRLALALAQQDLDDPVLTESLRADRFRVLHPSSDVYADTVAEIQNRRRSGSSTVGVFLMKRAMVDEFAERLTNLGIRHEISGLQDSAGDAEVAIAALARFAAGNAEWQDVVNRLAVFLHSSRRRRDNVPELLVHNLSGLPDRARQRLDELRTAVADWGDLSVGKFLSEARSAWAKLLLGGSPRMWEMGADDLRGQSIAIRAHSLASGGANELSQIAAMRRGGAVAHMLIGQPLPVRIMTRHQAKGREMDAVVIVNHPDDFEKAESLRNDRRVLFVMASRARQSVTLVLRPDPTSLFAPFAALAAE